MVRHFKSAVSAVLASVLAAVCAVTPSAKAVNTDKTLKRPTSYSGLAVKNYSDSENFKSGISVSSENVVLNGTAGSSDFLFKENDALTFEFTAEEKGTYQIACEYKITDDKMTNSLFALTVDGEDFTGLLPVLRRDKEEQYALDRDGNELPAAQTPIEEWVIAAFENYTDLNRSAISLELEAGRHRVTVKNNVQSIYVRTFYIAKPRALPSYAQYSESVKGKVYAEPIAVEGERYAVKNDSSVRGASVKNAALYPYETYCSRINILSEDWSSVGQKAVWEFEAPSDGLYAVSFRYKQNASTNMPVYRNMEIDGKALFEEMNGIEFPQTKSNTYSNFTLKADGKPAYIYLKAGSHTVSLCVTMGPLAEIYSGILALMEDVNRFGMDINKLASSSVDKNRTWDTEAYFPDAVSDLKSYAERANAFYKELAKLGGKEPVWANDLLYAAGLLEKIAKDSRTIPNKSADISMGDSSVSKYLGTVIGKMVNQSVALDRIYIGGETELPPARVTFWTSLTEGLKRFIKSFGNKTENKKSSELKVWMQSSIPYVQTLQQLVDEKYNSEHGTNIEISVMTGEQKLVLANAAGTNPDVVLGVGYGTPFNLAIRGAAKNLLEYDGFLDFYNKEYNLEALVPMCYGDGVYGATESQDFNILYYRKDILNTLGLDVPETWDDVKALMPLLLRYNMNFYLPLSASGAMKSMAVTGPFLYQHNADFYEKDGMKVAFDSLNAVTAFEQMTDIYNIYSVSNSVANFYNSFRYGEIPLGISGFSTYLQLELAAPELAENWDVALVPGEKQADGSVLRYQIADSTACMILEDTDKPDEAYSFLKWWLSSETQLSYATLLQSSLGNEYRWNTANLVAFKSLPYSEKHKQVILNQWEAQKEIAPHAASYMVQRETSNIWNNVVVNGKGLVESIDSAAILSNREIKRKMQEFGFCDSQGNPVKEYSVMTYADLVKLLKSEGEKQ